MSEAWWLYVLRCADDSLYTGITTDVERRVNEHRVGRAGAKALRGRKPLELVFDAPVGDRAAAQRVEYRVKRLSRQEKLSLLENPDRFRRELSRLAATAGSDRQSRAASP